MKMEEEKSSMCPPPVRQFPVWRIARFVQLGQPRYRDRARNCRERAALREVRATLHGRCRRRDGLVFGRRLATVYAIPWQRFGLYAKYLISV